MPQLENEAFLTALGQLYTGTKKWGTVWVTMKRGIILNILVYQEKFKYKGKREFKKQRKEELKKQADDPAAQFPVLIRAKTAKKKITTIVNPENIITFQQSLNKVMKANLLKNTEYKKDSAVKASKKRPTKGKEDEKEQKPDPKKFKSK